MKRLMFLFTLALVRPGWCSDREDCEKLEQGNTYGPGVDANWWISDCIKKAIADRKFKESVRENNEAIKKEIGAVKVGFGKNPFHEPQFVIAHFGFPYASWIMMEDRWAYLPEESHTKLFNKLSKRMTEYHAATIIVISVTGKVLAYKLKDSDDYYTASMESDDPMSTQ